MQCLGVLFERFPEMWSREPVAVEEIDVAEVRLGIAFAAGYRTFIAREGGLASGRLTGDLALSDPLHRT
jgi:hypothetical protein